MKITLVAINAKYIHSNLAILCLEKYAKKYLSEDEAKEIEMELVDYTINQQVEQILMDLYERKSDVLCFSCYLWNMNFVHDIAREIVKIMPGISIWLGGPEVSYDADLTLNKYSYITGIMRGEGEETFFELLKGMKTGEFQSIKGITYRSDNGEIIVNPDRPPIDLSTVPFVYDDMKAFENKIIYYETSRGCPFSCSYCLSSIDKKVRFRDIEIVKRELQFFLDHQVPQVKFVDRTFNCKHEHSMAIWKYILEHDNGITNFHFEIAADLIKEEELQLIEKMRPGLIQLEIGVQSTNLKTIHEIHRAMDLDVLRGIVDRIHRMRNIHQHLDLIVGLPYEDYDSFCKSYDDVYHMKPDQLQLGFLKVLKGSYMAIMQKEYGILHTQQAPYEVLATNWITYEDVIRLKGVEEMTEIYYNSHQFVKTLEEVEKDISSPFDFFMELWEYYKRRDLHKLSHKRSRRYEIFLGMLTEWKPEKAELFKELLTIDYYLRENAKSRPAFAGEDLTDKHYVREFYEREAEEGKYLPTLKSYDKNQLRKMTHLEYFKTLNQTILFDYSNRNPLDHEARTITFTL